MPHGADYRDTGVELATTKQEANGLTVVCSIRSAAPDVVADPSVPGGARLQAKYIPPLYIDYSEFSEEEQALDVAYRTMVERKIAAKVLAYQTSPERQAAKLTEALEAEARAVAADARRQAAEAEAVRIEAENIVRRAEQEQLDADLATMRRATDTQSKEP